MGKLIFLLALIGLCYGEIGVKVRLPRSIDLSAAHSLISDSKLPGEVKPNNYTLDLRTNIDENTFSGKVKIVVTFHEPTNQITLHASHDLEILSSDVTIQRLGIDCSLNPDTKQNESSKIIPIRRVDRVMKKPLLVIYLQNTEKQGTIAELEINFQGQIWESSEGLFKGSYYDNKEKKQYLATHMRPNNARRLFPCFDEPSFKAPFFVSISRPKNYATLFNTEVQSSEEIENGNVVDHFKATPPMPTFAFGFVISQLSILNRTTFHNPNLKNVCIKIYGRSELHDELDKSRVYERIEKSLLLIQNYFGVDFPLEKLDIVALPGFSTVKPVDNWGLIVYKESDLIQHSYYLIAQELTYQWLGSWVTPTWWSDSHINKAIAGFMAVQAALELDGGAEFEGKWPMTILYSIYYEFSKRFPHSKITGMKQETICSKTELVLRMLNLTLGPETFKNGLRRLFAGKEFKTFVSDDIWKALTEQAHIDKKLDEGTTIKEIVTSWIQKDRIPSVRVTRNYAEKSATISQKVYLRERPHDVPEQDKMLWWIPIVVVEEDNLNFKNTTPRLWMKKSRNEKMSGLVSSDKFIIVNPEEIGPFPVNYDEKNWNLLANYLQNEKSRDTIPVYTRAKLLHDAWNLAYAGSLSFGAAFNMTLFMKSERDHLVWNPVFTMIDHIGRHIDMSGVHKKFETYVRTLLTPLYEELGSVELENEENTRRNLRSLSKTFLCRAGYTPCIEEAQGEYEKWMNMTNPDEGNPVANQYICPVFKWGTMEEWEFGLQRVINFPTTRKQSERTYLLKTLAGCPSQREKILRLLNSMIMDENSNFSENDILLTFSMLSGSSTGYTTLFHFLSENWEALKIKFANKTNLWDNLIQTSTGVFTTHEGLEMVKKLYVQRQGEFGSAEHLIEKSLKNIKEETKWSDENLPIIEKWLDNFSNKINKSEKKKKFIG